MQETGLLYGLDFARDHFSNMLNSLKRRTQQCSIKASQLIVGSVSGIKRRHELLRLQQPEGTADGPCHNSSVSWAYS